MDWKLMDDAANIENRNAGNGGDLVKHTVYLAVLRSLLRQDPWSKGLLLRECHAGRGAYRMPEGDSRCRLLSCLYSSSTADAPILLQAQSSILGALGCWPSGAEALQWYAGSALVNAHALCWGNANCHKLELYEWLPETRRILRAVLDAAQPGALRFWNILPKEEQGEEFDGEAFVERNIVHWGETEPCAS